MSLQNLWINKPPIHTKKYTLFHVNYKNITPPPYLHFPTSTWEVSYKIVGPPPCWGDFPKNSFLTMWSIYISQNNFLCKIGIQPFWNKPFPLFLEFVIKKTLEEIAFPIAAFEDTITRFLWMTSLSLCWYYKVRYSTIYSHCTSVCNHLMARLL